MTCYAIRYSRLVCASFLHASASGLLGCSPSLLTHACHFSAGHAWMSEYGDPHNETDFEYLIKYSPLHNVRVPAGSHQYPAVMLTTGCPNLTFPAFICCPGAPKLCARHDMHVRMS